MYLIYCICYIHRNSDIDWSTIYGVSETFAFEVIVSKSNNIWLKYEPADNERLK